MSQKLIAECLGTFALSLAVLSSVSVLDSVIITPILAGLVLALFVYSIGSISGCHINPAVTLSLWSIGKINTKESVSYIAAQCVGAAVAVLVVMYTIGSGNFGFASESLGVFIAELIGAAFFTFGIAAVVMGRVQDTASGVLIGGSLLFGIILAVHLGSAGILNPAVAIALGSVSFSYVFGSIVGGIIGMQTYRCLSCEKNS